MNKKNNKGFSLVELIVVIAVMAVLVVVLAPAYLRYVDKARLQKDVSAISEVVQTVKLAAAEGSVSSEIQSTGTSVKIDAAGNITVVGAYDVSKSAVYTDQTTSNLYKEVVATVGSKLDISSKALTATGAEVVINVTLASNGSAEFTISGPTDAAAKLLEIAPAPAPAQQQ